MEGYEAGELHRALVYPPSPYQLRSFIPLRVRSPDKAKKRARRRHNLSGGPMEIYGLNPSVCPNIASSG